MADKKQSKVSFPPLNLAKQRRIAAKLINNFGKLSQQFYGEKCEGVIFTGLCNYITNQISTDEFVVSPVTIQSVASYLLNQTLDFKNLKFLFKFIAANYDSIKINQAVMPSKLEDGILPGWAYVQFKDLALHKEEKKAFIEFRLKVVSGPWYGNKVIKRVDLSSMYLSALLSRSKVNTRRRRTGTPRDLIRLYAFVRLMPTAGISGDLSFWDYLFSPYISNLNKKLISERKKPCPRGLNNPCAGCKIGYKECPRGTRPVTLTIKETNGSIQNSS